MIWSKERNILQVKIVNFIYNNRLKISGTDSDIFNFVPNPQKYPNFSWKMVN